MKKQAVIFLGVLCLSGVANAQYGLSAVGASVPAAEINSKPAFQIVSGPPTALTGTAGKDFAYDFVASKWYIAKVSGSPATWGQVEELLTFSAGLTRAGQSITCAVASGSVVGCLSTADWTTFNSKLSNPFTTTGDISMSTGGTTGGRLAAGAADTFLQGNGAGVAPSYGTLANCVAAGGVLQYSTSTHLFSCHTLASADIPNNAANTSGTASNITGTAAAANGGTGQTSYTIGDLLFASGSTALSKLAAGAADTFLRGNGAGVAPSYGAFADCVAAGGVEQYSTSTHLWSCHTLASADIPNNAANTSGTSANLSGTPALPNGTLATTQSANDNSTKIGTTAYTNTAVAGSVSIIPVTFSATPTFTVPTGVTDATFTIASLTGNVTSSTLVSAASPVMVTVRVCQDATGSRTFAFPANFINYGTISALANKCSVQKGLYDGTNVNATTPMVTDNTPGGISGNAKTATALAANGTNCSAGSYPLGVDASGNAEGCTVAGGGGIATMNVNSADPNIAPVTGSAPTPATVNFNFDGSDLWWANGTNTWKKILSTTNAGPYANPGAVGPLTQGVAASRPACSGSYALYLATDTHAFTSCDSTNWSATLNTSGSIVTFYETTSGTQMSVDASGNLGIMPRVAAARTANQFVTHVPVTGIPAVAAIVDGDLPVTAVTPGAYTNANVTVNANGRITAAASGSAGGGGVNAQTANYTLVSGDTGKLVTMNCSSCTASLPAATPSATWWAAIQNTNSTDLAISRNGLTINGATSNITLKQFQWAFVFSDGSNYRANPPVAAGANITLTMSAVAQTIIGAASTGCTPSGSTGALQMNNGAGACSAAAIIDAAGILAIGEPMSMGSAGTARGISITATANSTGVTAKLLAAKDTTNPIAYQTASSGGCGSGIAAATATSTTFEMYVVPGLVLTGVADNAVTAGHILVGGTTTPGRVKDSGQTSRSLIPISTCIVGVAQASASTGADVLLRYDGPDAKGSLLPLRSTGGSFTGGGGGALMTAGTTAPDFISCNTIVDGGGTAESWDIHVTPVGAVVTFKVLRNTSTTTDPTTTDSINTSGVANANTSTVLHSTTFTDFTGSAAPVFADLDKVCVQVFAVSGSPTSANFKINYR